MAAEVFEDSWELEVPTVEAEPPDPDDLGAAYPWVRLRPTGAASALSFRTVVLQNEHLRLTCCPDLGGRILEIHDRRTGIDVIPRPANPALQQGGTRGVWLPMGIQVAAGAAHRANSMGPVDYQVRDAADDSCAASIAIHELVAGLGTSWHASIVLEPSEAAFEIRFRQINRGLLPAKALCGLLVPTVEAWSFRDAIASYDPDRDGGLVISPLEGSFEAWEDLGADTTALLAAPSRLLGPRDTIAWSVRIIPFSGIGSPIAAGSAGALALDGDRLRIQVSRSIEGHRLVLQAADGEALEAPIDAEASRTLELSLKGVATPAAFALRGPGGADLLSWMPDAPPRAVGFPEQLTAPVRTVWDEAFPTDSVEAGYLRSVSPISKPGLKRALSSALVRGPALVALAMESLAAKRFAEAAQQLEEALLYNAQDHLCWWLRAVSLRLAGADSEESPELLNAHYLAPLEPALRAESLLSQGPAEGAEANPILAQLAGNPEALVEVACLYLEAGLFDQAARWIDEALRHQDLPILRYLLAWSYLVGSTMEAEAAEQVRRARGNTVGPPLPWRRIEGVALRALADRFPGEVRLEGYLHLLDAAAI